MLLFYWSVLYSVGFTVACRCGQEKSDEVKAKVMARRNKTRQQMADRVAAVQQAEEDKRQAEVAKDEAKTKFAARLKDWAEGTTGERRHVRTLLAHLHEVLWEGAKWEPLPMAKLVQVCVFVVSRDCPRAYLWGGLWCLLRSPLASALGF